MLTSQVSLLMLLLCPAVSFAAPADLLNDTAPDFVLPSLKNGNIRISEFRSEVVVLNFWSDWCGKCNRLMPLLSELNRSHTDKGLKVIAIDINGDADSARQLVDAYSLEFPVLLDARQDVSRDYDLNRLPVTLLIDREGTVRYMQQGAGEEAQGLLAAEVMQLLTEQKTDFAKVK